MNWVRRIAKAALAALSLIGACVVMVATFPIASLVASHMSAGWDDRPADVLVVLGGSMLVPGTGPNAVMGSDTYLRSVYASWILHTSSYRYVVVSGWEGLAPAMQRWLTFAGTNGARIVQENAGRTTFENATFSRKLINQLSRSRTPTVTILTSDYHSWRARQTFEKAGLHVRCIAIPDVTKSSGNWRARLSGAMTVAEELAKDCYYSLSGKL